MRRLIIQKNREVVEEILLESRDYIIGRNSKSDIYLNDPSISRKHAKLVQVQDDIFIEDMESTNGTRHNDRQVTRQLLKDQDLIQIGCYELLYAADQVRKEVADETDPDITVCVQVPDSATGDKNAKKGLRALNPKVAVVRFFRGPKKGQLERITRSLYTVGQPGGEVAAIARRPQGFFLLHIGGDSYPKINNQEISTPAGIQLNEGDVIEVGEHLVEISLDK